MVRISRAAHLWARLRAAGACCREMGQQSDAGLLPVAWPLSRKHGVNEVALGPDRMRTLWLELEGGDWTGLSEDLRASLCARGGEAPDPAAEAPALPRMASLLRRLLWSGLAALGAVASLILLLSRAAGRGAGRAGEDSRGFELLFEGEVPQEDFAVHVGSVCFGPSEVIGGPGSSELGLAGHLLLEVVSDVDWSEARCLEWMADDSLLQPGEADRRGLAFHRPDASGPGLSGQEFGGGQGTDAAARRPLSSCRGPPGRPSSPPLDSPRNPRRNAPRERAGE
ncbi:unnamed protein product [Prorocentrum cordatum]|uniref:Uncharacterized protein n=1 Tax=Prorocentrum cordatum TaxID=2364126 RepID=A0ABN9VDE0_9DINO|nr:unnamed protein product [Polarella glacialis]